MQSYMIKNILIDKHDYTQIEKQALDLVKDTIDRLDEINNDMKKIREKWEEILALNALTAINLDKEMSSSLIPDQKSFSSSISSHNYYRSATKKRSHRTDEIDRFVAKKSNKNDNIYIKLSDSQAACRYKYRRRNQSDIFSSHDRLHHQQQREKLPVYYRRFPFSLDAGSKYNNAQKQYVNQCHIKSTNHVNQLRSKKGTQTKISVDIRKKPCMDMDSREKIHEPFVCFGMTSCLINETCHSSILEDIGSINFVDGSTRLAPSSKQAHSKDNEDECDIHSSESGVENVLKQLVNSILISAYVLTEHDEFVACLLYQSPLQAIRVFDIKPAFIVTFISCIMKMSILQLPCLTPIISESDTTPLWECHLALKIRLIDNIFSGAEDNKKIILDDDNTHDQSNISKSFTHQHSNGEENSGKFHVLNPLSSTNQRILEKKSSTSNSSDQLLQNYELDYSATNTKEERDPQFNVTEEINHDLKSTVMIKPDRFIDQSYGIANIHETDEQESATNAHQLPDDIQKSNEIQPEIYDDTSIVLDEKSLSPNELHITIPRCMHLCNSFEQTIHRKSDPLFSTATKESTLHNSPYSNILQNDEDSLKRTLLQQTKMRSSDFKDQTALDSPISTRSTSSNNVDLESAYRSSEPLPVQLDSAIQQFNQQNKSTKQLKVSRIMTIPRKPFDDIIPCNDSNSAHQPRKYYVKNQFSDAQLNTSSPQPKERLKCKKKIKLPVVSTKCPRQQKQWVSPTTNIHPFKRSLHPTSLSFQKLRNPCQILEVYTRFKRIHCKPYAHIYTPLSSCFC